MRKVLRGEQGSRMPKRCPGPIPAARRVCERRQRGHPGAGTERSGPTASLHEGKCDDRCEREAAEEVAPTRFGPTARAGAARAGRRRPCGFPGLRGLRARPGGPLLPAVSARPSGRRYLTPAHPGLPRASGCGVCVGRGAPPAPPPLPLRRAGERARRRRGGRGVSGDVSQRRLRPSTALTWCRGPGLLVRRPGRPRPRRAGG